jgi:NAD(P)-dependent dehydrogenase (short-subunit alcohol dehydrogenase family)
MAMAKRVALVTGASSGIGAAAAIKLRERGFTVYAAGRRRDRLEAIAGNGIIPLVFDVSDDAACVNAINQILEEQGRIDVLVNNAGYGALGAIEDVPAAEGIKQFEVNVFGPIRLIQLVLPHMREEHSGRIINVSSIGGKVYSLLGGWYHGTKFALEGMTDSLRLEVEPFGIDVSLIEPGAIATEWGTIAADNVERTSGTGAYADAAHAVAASLRKPTEGGGVSPDVVADAIVKAAADARPKTRYPVGSNAKSAVLSRRLLSDRQFDKIARRAVK